MTIEKRMRILLAAAAGALALSVMAAPAVDPLPSWNEGPAKQKRIPVAKRA